MDTGLSFGYVLEAIQEGRSFTRKGWNAKHRISLQKPTELSKMTLPYIYMTTAITESAGGGNMVPWVASHTDMLSKDWAEVK